MIKIYTHLTDIHGEPVYSTADSFEDHHVALNHFSKIMDSHSKDAITDADITEDTVVMEYTGSYGNKSKYYFIVSEQL